MSMGVENGGSRMLTVMFFGTLGEEAHSALFDLRWMLVFIVALIVADFWFGVSDSLKNKKKFRFSRAGRRTCNKAMDYLMYLLAGALLGKAIFEPLGWADHTVTAAIGLGLGCVWEIDSIVGHVCALHGVTNRLSVKRLIVALLKKKDKDLGEVVEEALEEKDGSKGGA